jgi:hypothetical protein
MKYIRAKVQEILQAHRSRSTFLSKFPSVNELL